ncbi:MAG: hypothetical protein HWE22_11310 [Flavobacteriales bacterium]|nr:hypothetical protein [Flavobacteriales bacterium]
MNITCETLNENIKILLVGVIFILGGCGDATIENLKGKTWCVIEVVVNGENIDPEIEEFPFKLNGCTHNLRIRESGIADLPSFGGVCYMAKWTEKDGIIVFSMVDKFKDLQDSNNHFIDEFRIEVEKDILTLKNNKKTIRCQLN